jgi:hypothetical protein
MPLLDHFHPPLHGPRRWEGFHHAWATFIAQQLSQETLPPGYFAEPEIRVDFARLDSCEVRVYQDLGGAELRGAIELVSPANKDREGSRRTFAAKCADHLQHGIGLIIVDIVTARTANLHEELLENLEARGSVAAWASSTGLYAVAYRAVTVREAPHVEMWAEALTLGAALPVLPLWLAVDLCVPVRLEEGYLATCRSLRIPA